MALKSRKNMATLFDNIEDTVKSFLSRYSLKASMEFIECADCQLTDKFVKSTGLKPGKNVGFTIGSHVIGLPVYSEYERPSNSWGASYIGRKLNLQLCINENWNPVTIFWKSKTGKDYLLHSTDIDCNDIEFWFERLDTELYLKQLYPNDKLPFKLKDLTFKLVVNRINLNCIFDIKLRPNISDTADSIIQQLHKFVGAFNTNSEKKDRKDGIVHNSKGWINEKGNIIYEMDLGSTGVSFLKKILIFMSDIDCFEKVELE